MEFKIEHMLLGDIQASHRERLKQLTVDTSRIPGAQDVMARILESGRINTDVFLALVPDHIIGWAVLLEQANFFSLFVDKDHRRQGVGRALLSAAHDKAVSRVRVRMMPHDAAGQGFVRAVKPLVEQPSRHEDLLPIGSDDFGFSYR